MLLRRHATDEVLDLGSAPVLGEGGQARILGVSDTLVAKIYHRPRESLGRKLDAMLASPPADPMLATGHVSIAWPVDLLSPIRGGRGVAGFLMPRVMGTRPIFEFYNPKSRRQHCPFFDYAYLHRAARNLAAAVTAVHSRGYVVGDLNESNVLLRDTALVTLVDTDSFQVRDHRCDELHRCPVGKAEYTPPELQGRTFSEVERTAQHDGFALAVLTFQLLMEGTHPYMGEYRGVGDAPSLERRIAAGHFAFAAATGGPFVPPPHAPPFDTLSPTIQELFLRCFGAGHLDAEARPDPREWQSAMREAESALVTCATNEQHRYGGHLTACPWCARATRLAGRDPFPSRIAAVIGTSGGAARAPVMLPAQSPLPSAGSVGGTAGALPAAGTPVAMTAATRGALSVARGPRKPGRAGRAPARGHLSAVRHAHASWIGAALVLALLTVASASMFWMAVGGMLAASCAVMGWRRVQAITPGLRPSIGFVMALIAVLLGVKTMVTLSAATTWRQTDLGIIDMSPPLDTRDHGDATPPLGLVPTLTEASAGADQSCAIDRRAELYCWGRNWFARARSSAQEDDVVAQPTRIPMLAGVAFREVSVSGAGHGCAIATDERLYCWGRNDFGQVGVAPAETQRMRSNSVANDPVPVDVWGNTVTTGGAHTCVLDGTTARCFGWNAFGQLGSGSLDDGSATARDVSDIEFLALAAGGRHTCGIATDGAAYCWGFNGSGQLGVPAPYSGTFACDLNADGTSAYCAPQPVRVPGGIRFRAITAGADHTCALSTEDRLYCWGLGDHGQLGSGGRFHLGCEQGNSAVERCSSDPLEVAGGVRFTAVRAGYAHTCAVDSFANAFCWGSNSHGQLGTDDAGHSCRAGGQSTNCSLTPLKVEGFSARSISAGRRHTCAVTELDRTICWGGNEYGQAGTGVASATVPLRQLIERAPGATVQIRDLLDRRLRARGSPSEDADTFAALAPVYFAHQVDRPARRRPRSPEPSYPEVLQAERVAGTVVVQVIVDTLGYAEMTSVRLLRSAHPAFTSAVMRMLPLLRFDPAEKDGRAVRQIVRLPYHFAPRR